MEQRKNQRFDLHLDYEIKRAGYRTKITGKTRNISSCGILFETSTAIPVGEKIEYSITLHSVEDAQVEVKIRGTGKIARRLPQRNLLAVSVENYEMVREAVQPMVAAAAATAAMMRRPVWGSELHP